MYELLCWEITHQQIFNSYVLGCALGNDNIKKGKKDPLETYIAWYILKN